MRFANIYVRFQLFWLFQQCQSSKMAETLLRQDRQKSSLPNSLSTIRKGYSSRVMPLLSNHGTVVKWEGTVKGSDGRGAVGQLPYEPSGTLIRCLRQLEAGRVMPKGLALDWVLGSRTISPDRSASSVGGAHHERYLCLEWRISRADWLSQGWVDRSWTSTKGGLWSRCLTASKHSRMSFRRFWATKTWRFRGSSAREISLVQMEIARIGILRKISYSHLPPGHKLHTQSSTMQ